MKTEVTLNTSEHFPFTTEDAFEFRVAPIRWGQCARGKTVQLSSSDKDYKSCAARVQSMVGEQSCSRRRGSMLWPRTATLYLIDQKTMWHPCECCADSVFTDSGPTVHPLDAIWNVVWNKDCVHFMGEDSCGRSVPEDNHVLGTTVCQGGDCTPDNDRWTCCHEFWKGSYGSCNASGEHNVTTEEVLQGASWGGPYLPSEAIEPFNGVGAQACGTSGRRPAMPKTPDQRARLIKAMRNWPQGISFVWLGLLKDKKTSMWKWDDGTPLDPQPKFGELPWDVEEPSSHDNQRGCIDRQGRWHGCSWSVSLRTACETFS